MSIIIYVALLFIIVTSIFLGCCRKRVRERFAEGEDDVHDIARPKEHYDITAQPINDRLYFIEVQQDVIDAALKPIVKNQLSQPWDTMVPTNKYPNQGDIEQMILRALHAHIDTWEPVQGLIIPFQIKKMSLVECKSPGDKAPFYYSRWSFIIHRDTKLLGFLVSATFLHYNLKATLCEYEIQGEVFEDKVEMLVSNQHEYTAYASP